MHLPSHSDKTLYPLAFHVYWPALAPSSPSDDDDIVPLGDGGLTVFGALEKQLGLKLEPKKILFDVFVIDHADKTPVEN